MPSGLVVPMSPGVMADIETAERLRRGATLPPKAREDDDRKESMARAAQAGRGARASASRVADAAATRPDKVLRRPAGIPGTRPTDPARQHQGPCCRATPLAVQQQHAAAAPGRGGRRAS